MKSDTQKHWNEYWGNKKERKSHKPPIAIIVIILICIISAGYYYRENGSFEGKKTTKNDFTNIDHKLTQSNKNGSKMAEGIKTIEKIIFEIKDIKELSDSKKEELISTIMDIDLSSEYTELKTSMIKKIELLQVYLEKRTVESLNEFNSIKYLKVAAKCFKKAGVKYFIDKDKINFEYYKDF